MANPRAHAQSSARYGGATVHVISASRRYERAVREIEFDGVDGGRTYDQGARLQRVTYQAIWCEDSQHEDYAAFLAEVDAEPRLLVDPLFGALQARVTSVDTQVNAEEMAITATIECLEAGDVEETTTADPILTLVGEAAIAVQSQLARQRVTDLGLALEPEPMPEALDALAPTLAAGTLPEGEQAREDTSAALRALEAETSVEAAQAHRDLLLLRLAWDVTTAPEPSRFAVVIDGQPALTAAAEIGLTDDADVTALLVANPTQDPLRMRGRLEVPVA